MFYALLTSLFLLFSVHSPAQENPEQSLQNSMNEFAFSLYFPLNDVAKNNLLYSPYSIFSCLSMLYLGARDQTAVEFKQLLNLTVSPSTLGKLYANNFKMLEGEKNGSYLLRSANGIWFDLDTFILSPFRHAVEDDYGSKLQALDFHQKEAALTTINQWTSTQTEGKIPHLLEKDDIDDGSRMVLTNAIYFRGDFISPFDPKRTVPSPFFSRPGMESQVRMMDQTGNFLYMENAKGQLLALLFKGTNANHSKIAFLCYLPKTDHLLSELESDLLSLTQSMDSLKEKGVHVKIPQFCLNFRSTLNDPLQKLGLREAFTDQANFSGIDGMRDLFLNKVIHESFFYLNETGVTAAAATSATLNMTSTLQTEPPSEFIADHPFLFFIVDLTTQTFLFIGKVSEPSTIRCN